MRKLYAVLALVCFCAGLFVLLKPKLNNIAAEKTEIQEIGRYKENQKELSVKEGLAARDGTWDGMEILPELRAACEAYNTGLTEASEFAYGSKFPVDPAAYGWTDPVFGVLYIPALDSELPLYLGATDANLMLGVGVLGQTSIPIGGPSTHSIICGHRTWRGDDKLLDIDKLVIGDEVRITNLWETLHYKVVDIHIIDPTDYSLFAIQPGRDLISIFTCHPANVSSHRYVLTCERCE